jgi:uncharacterized membrane protein YdjX (TVP38/TMEM64 family)
MSTLVTDAVGWIEQLGPAVGAAVLVLATAACVVSAVLPTAPLNLAAPFVTGGVLSGSLAIAAGCTLGSAANFALGRVCLRAWAQRRIQASPKLRAFEAALAGPRAARMVALSRLSPVFPFALIGYVLGATHVSFCTFTWATLAGVWPSCALFAWISQATRDTVVAATAADRSNNNDHNHNHSHSGVAAAEAHAAGGGGGAAAAAAAAAAAGGSINSGSLASVLGIVVGVLATVLVSWQAKISFDEGACISANVRPRTS